MRGRKSKRDTFLKYPTPTLAVISLLTIIFSAGLAWAGQAARLAKLEDTYVKQTELQELKGLIQSLQEKVDVKFDGIEKSLTRIEKKVWN